jgi:hypothetical protein
LPGVSRLVGYLPAVGLAGQFLYHLVRHSRAYLGLFADDFFYYAIIADKFVRFGKLTFDGITSTNGFHPLWFLVLVGVRFFCGPLGTAFFACVAAILIALLVATYEAFRVFARALGAPSAIGAPIAAFATAAASPFFVSGMEVAIAIPLYTLFLTEVARADALGGSETQVAPSRSALRAAAKLGLLASLAILGRVDLALAVALVIAWWLVAVRPRLASAVPLLAAFGAGGIAVPIYFAFNKVAFSGFLPGSALAKELRTSAGLSINVLRVAIGVYGKPTLTLLLIAIVGLLVIARRASPTRAGASVASGVALVFPFAFTILNALVSDWFFFPWYAYPMPTAVVAAGVVLWRWAEPLLREPQRPALAAIALAVAACVLVPAGVLSDFLKHGPGWLTEDNTLLSMALELKERLGDRTGTFAMGDKAGITTLVLGQPVVQLEGLVADGRLREHIRNQDSLGQVIDEYGIDYLIVSLVRPSGLEHPEAGCYEVVSPNPLQAGERSARMSGRICAPPVVHFFTMGGPHRWSGFLPLETFVFDLRGDRRRALVTGTKALAH